MNLASILDHAARLYGDRRAICCRRESWTYHQFSGRVARLAAVLRAEGIGRASPLAMLHRNCHHFLEAYFATAALDAMFIPLNHRLSDQELAAILEDGQAGCLLTEAFFAERAHRITGSIPDRARPCVLCHGSESGDLEKRLADLPAGRLPQSEAGPDDPAQLYYTSGTTGEPKGVILTHGNVTTHALAAIAELGLRETDVWLHAAPLFHLADAWATWAITWVGGRHVMLPDFDSRAVAAAMADHGVTITNLIPTMLVDLVHSTGIDPQQLRSMRLILSGGAPMAPELLKRIEALFPCDYVQTYGLTETSPYLTLSLLKEELRGLSPDRQQGFRATTGRPMLGVDLKVIDPDGQPVPWDGSTVGEIVVRGPTVTPGYYKRPQDTARAFKDGWFHTGDLAHVLPEGYLTIVDRLKDVINSGGEVVYSTQVENCLFAHPAVQEAAVVAIPHRKWGEVVHAAIVLKEGCQVTPDEMMAHCRTSLASFKVPRSIQFLAELPRTGSGKIDKKALREPFWAGESKRVK